MAKEIDDGWLRIPDSVMLGAEELFEDKDFNAKQYVNENIHALSQEERDSIAWSELTDDAKAILLFITRGMDNNAIQGK